MVFVVVNGGSYIYGEGFTVSVQFIAETLCKINVFLFPFYCFFSNDVVVRKGIWISWVSDAFVLTFVSNMSWMIGNLEW